MSPENLVVCSWSACKILNWWTETRKRKGTKQKAIVSIVLLSPLRFDYRDGVKTRKNSDSSRVSRAFIFFFFFSFCPDQMRQRCMWKHSLNCRIFYNYEVPSSSSCTIRTSMWKVRFHTIISQVTSFCTLLQPEAKIQPEKKSWQPDETQTENKNEQEQPHTQREQTRTARRKKSSNCLHTPACFHLLAFKEAQLLGSPPPTPTAGRRKAMLPERLDGCSRQGQKGPQAKLNCKLNDRFNVCYAKLSKWSLLVLKP